MTSNLSKRRVLVITIMLLILVKAVSGATLTVCSSGCNATLIQGAINSSSVGDTINISNGTYMESLIIDKKIILQGAGHGPNGTTLTNANNGQAITITTGGNSSTDRLVIRDLTIANSTGNNSQFNFLSGTAIDIKSNMSLGYITLENLHIIDNFDGWGLALRVNHSNGINDLKINNSIFSRGSNGIGQPPYNGSEDGYPGTTKVNNFTICNTTFSDYDNRGLYGYWLFSNMSIINSSFFNNIGHGAHFRWVEGLVIQDSAFWNNGLGTQDDEPEWPDENAGIKFECRGIGNERPENQPCKDILIQTSNFTNNGIGVLDPPSGEIAGTGENIGSGLLFFSETVNTSNVIINNSVFYNNTHNGIYAHGNNSNISITVLNSNIYSNGQRGVSTFIPILNLSGNVSGANVMASYNYWGDLDGPGEQGFGNGNNVSTNVSFSPMYISINKTDKLYHEVLATSVSTDFNSINWLNTNSSNVTSHLSLIKIGENSTLINWETNNSNVITNKGRVTRQDENTTVLLTSTVRRLDSVSREKNITITVKANNITDTQAVSNAKTNLTFDDIKLSNNIETNITNNLNLILNGINNTNITWSSSNTNVIENSGSVSRTLTNTNVDLTATIRKGSVSDTKIFNFVVVGTSDPDELDLSSAKLDLTDSLVLNGNLAKDDVRSDLYLPSSLPGHTNVTITWSSSISNINTSSTRGIITRNNTIEITGTLTANLSKNSKYTEKTFLLTIKLGEPSGIYDNTGKISILDDTIEIIIDNTNINNISSAIAPVNIGSETRLLNLLNILNVTTGNLTIPNNLTLIREVSGGNHTVEIPGNTIISGGVNWNGLIIIPTSKDTTQYVAPSGTVDLAIEVGSKTELNLSSPSKIILNSMSGKNAAYANNGTILTEITTTCNSATNNSNIIGNGECYFDDGSDLVIWTYHFTIFAAYTPPVVVPPSSSGGGGGGGNIPSAPNKEDAVQVTRTLSESNGGGSNIEEQEKQEKKQEVKKEVKKEIPKKIKKVLFDINLDLPAKIIELGKEILATIGLLNIGDPGRVEAKVHYELKDHLGNILFEETEIVEVETQTEFIKKINTNDLEAGDYSFSAELEYEGQKEPAIAEKTFRIKPDFSYSIFLQLALALLTALAIPTTYVLSESLKKKDEDHLEDTEEMLHEFEDELSQEAIEIIQDHINHEKGITEETQEQIQPEMIIEESPMREPTLEEVYEEESLEGSIEQDEPEPPKAPEEIIDTPKKESEVKEEITEETEETQDKQLVQNYEQGFHLSNGTSLNSINEFKLYLKEMPDEIFNEHVNENENHFADWIQNVFGASGLAEQVRNCKDKKSMSKIL